MSNVSRGPLWDDIAEIVQRHLPVFYEIEAIDVQFRRNLNSAEHRSKPPWIMMGRKELQHEEHALWKGLDEGTIDDAEMVKRTVSLMEIYYREDLANELPVAPSYRNHVGSVELANLSRQKQDELIRTLFTKGGDFRNWVLENDVTHAQPFGLACITRGICALTLGEMYDDTFLDEEDDRVRVLNEEQMQKALNVLAGTKLWLRLEEAFPPFDKVASPTDYNWKEMERFAEIGGLEMEEVRELRNHLDKIPDPVDGIYFRLPYEKYKEGWDNGKLALYVDRGLATQLYQHAEPSWSHWLPLVFFVGLFAFIPVMIFAGILWGLAVLALAVLARKILSSKAVNWVRQDSLSDRTRYRFYSARKIVWAQKI